MLVAGLISAVLGTRLPGPIPFTWAELKFTARSNSATPLRPHVGDGETDDKGHQAADLGDESARRHRHRRQRVVKKIGR